MLGVDDGDGFNDVIKAGNSDDHNYVPFVGCSCE
jgi:hypothetical protein